MVLFGEGGFDSVSVIRKIVSVFFCFFFTSLYIAVSVNTGIDLYQFFEKKTFMFGGKNYFFFFT